MSAPAGTRAEAEPDAVSVTLLDGLGHVLAEQDALRPHYAASLMKVPLAAAVLAWLETHGLGPHDVVDIPPAYRSAVGGDRFEIPAEGTDDTVRRSRSMSFEQLLLRMIAVSSNDATNVLLDHIGVTWLQRWLLQHTTGIAVTRPLYDQRATTLGMTNTVTAQGMARLLLDATVGALNGGPADACLLWLLSRQQHVDMIAEAVPGSWRSSGKDGIASGAVHDSRILIDDLDALFVLVILTSSADVDLDARIRAVRRVAADLVPVIRANAQNSCR